MSTVGSHDAGCEVFEAGLNPSVAVWALLLNTRLTGALLSPEDIGILGMGQQTDM